jgi:hypothetical protein
MTGMRARGKISLNEKGPDPLLKMLDPEPHYNNADSQPCLKK